MVPTTCLIRISHRDDATGHIASQCVIGRSGAWATQADVDAYQQTEDWTILQAATKLLGIAGQVQFCSVMQTKVIQLNAQSFKRTDKVRDL